MMEDRNYSAWQGLRPEDAPRVPHGDEAQDVPATDPEFLIYKAFESNFDEAVEMLFRWYYAPLCNHAVRFVWSREVAEDIVSDVFSNIYLQRTFSRQQGGSFRAYLFTCVRNRAFNYVRSEMQRNFPLDHADRVMCQDQQPDEITEYEDLYHDVENAINELSVRRRSIYLMSRVDGKKHEEIARELEISVKTVKEHMYQALMQVRKSLRDKWLLAVPFFIFNMAQVWNQL